jgi:hypothetical protein
MGWGDQETDAQGKAAAQRADEGGRLLSEWNLNGLFGLLLRRKAHPSGDRHHVNVELARL